MKAWTTLFVIGMFATTVAMADDVDDVKAAVQSYYAALNSGNGAALAQLRIPEYSFFGGGGLIDRSSSSAQQRDDFQALADAGRKLDLQLRHMEVRVYGNAAVVTGYSTGTNTAPDGTVNQTRQQRTGVWIKQGGQWREAHRHASPLTISTTRIEDRFVGTWSFVSIERRNARGGVVPFENPLTSGVIIYTPAGQMAVQLVRGDRQKYAADQPTGEEAQAALGSYLAYYGPFTVNEAEGTVTHHREAHSNPGEVRDVVRSYQFSGNRLMLTPPSRVVNGEELTTTLTWERIE